MVYKLVLEMRGVPGAIIRALGLVERRQFALCSVSARARPTDGQLELVIEVDAAGRSPQTLVRQLEKLFDVESVACWPQTARQEARISATPEYPATGTAACTDPIQPIPATVPA